MVTLSYDAHACVLLQVALNVCGTRSGKQLRTLYTYMYSSSTFI
jgi:hypothetical protein